mgnify:CR=1 FL=1
MLTDAHETYFNQRQLIWELQRDCERYLADRNEMLTELKKQQDKNSLLQIELAYMKRRRHE